MLTLSGSPDHLIVLSAGLTSAKNCQKTNRICLTIFSSFYRICHFNNMLSSVIVELYSSLWHILTCVTCFVVMLSLGSFFLFIIGIAPF